VREVIDTRDVEMIGVEVEIEMTTTIEEEERDQETEAQDGHDPVHNQRNFL